MILSLSEKMDASLITAFRMSLCGFICFVIAQYFHLSEGYWAVVTVSAITRANFSATFAKALLRLAGTLLGAGVGYFAAVSIGDSPYQLFSVVILIASLVSYFFRKAIESDQSY